MADTPDQDKKKCICEDQTDWKNRPFRRSNTQSEPEDVSMCPCDSSEEEGDVECLRCCTDYYHLSKRASSELKRDPEGLNYIDKGTAPRNYSPERRADSSWPLARWDSDSDSSEAVDGEKVTRPQSVVGEVLEGFRLILFIAMPMLARQIGSILSRRILTRMFGRNSC